MLARGMASVWWPGIGEDVGRVRASCRRCDVNTPSQSKEPPHELEQPSYPFQKVCADYFSLQGRQYLVMVDRYSGWASVHQPKLGGSAKEFVRTLQGHCETFGVPEELSSDGGPQFVAGVTGAFLKLWGISHRLS